MTNALRNVLALQEYVRAVDALIAESSAGQRLDALRLAGDAGHSVLTYICAQISAAGPKKRGRPADPRAPKKPIGRPRDLSPEVAAAYLDVLEEEKARMEAEAGHKLPEIEALQRLHEVFLAAKNQRTSKARTAAKAQQKRVSRLRTELGRPSLRRREKGN